MKGSREACDAAPAEGLRGGGAARQLLARRRGAAPDAAGGLDADPQAGRPCRAAAVREAGAQDLPHRCRPGAAAPLPPDHPPVRGGASRDDSLQGRGRRAAERRGDQRRRLLPAQPAGGVRAPPPGRGDQPAGAQPRRPAAPPGREPDRPGGDGAPARGCRHRGRGLRAAPVPDRRAAGPCAAARTRPHAGAAGARAVHRARGRLGHAPRDGRCARPLRRQAEHRARGEEHRDHQAGGDRRHGRGFPFRPHRQPRAARRQPGGAGRGRLPRAAALVPGAAPAQAAAAGGARVPRVPVQ